MLAQHLYVSMLQLLLPAQVLLCCALTWALKHKRYCVTIIRCFHGDNVIIPCTLEDLCQIV